MVKKITLTMLGLSVSGLSMAGTMYSTPPAPTCIPGNVTVPCDVNLWDISAHALYLKPIYNGSHSYLPTAIGGLKAIRPDFGWGYRLEGSYHFNTGNDVSMNWLHYDVRDPLGHFNGHYPQVLPSGSIAFIPTTFRASISNKFDQVNLIVGQQVGMGVLKTRFYAGGQYADIRPDTVLFYNISPIFLAAIGGGARGVINTDFNGFGPILGIDYSYALPYGLSLTATTASSILYGSSHFNTMTIYNNGLIVSPIYASKKKIVPSFEVKLGANYVHPLAQGLLSIEGGYQAMNYFNSLQAPGFSTTSLSSNFGLYGPYFGLKWLGTA